MRPLDRSSGFLFLCMLKVLKRIGFLTVALYLLICSGLYFFQEKIIFFPQKLSADYIFRFDTDFEEITFKVSDGDTINTLLFKADSSKGLIFYLHGNAGSLASWGDVAQVYTKRGYDVLLVDYRGYGKSTGQITSQDQLYSDNQMIYDQILSRYAENHVIILGYSIGTGMAAKLASENSPKQLILQAPYFSLIDMMKRRFTAIPTFILKYKFETNKYLEKVECPIVIFHGLKDSVIPFDSSVKLKNQYPSVHVIALKNQGHNGMSNNRDYLAVISQILNQY